MVALVDEENSVSVRRLRQASPVGAIIYRSSHEEAASETEGTQRCQRPTQEQPCRRAYDADHSTNKAFTPHGVASGEYGKGASLLRFGFLVLCHKNDGITD